MIKTINIALSPSDAAADIFIKKHIAIQCGINENDITGFNIIKRSIDARNKEPKVLLSLDVFINEKVIPIQKIELQLKNVSNATEVVVVGAGPAGLFAAIKLIELGLKPIIIERGKDVRSRRRDLAAMNKDGIVNPESNYCFGEGGAGTYSDGKLYTRSTKRGNVQRILQIFNKYGANDDILHETHPHIGTNKLPQIITAMREQIVACGGQVLFEKKLTDILLYNDSVVGIKTADNETITCKHLILATGHSARDIFVILHNKGIAIESKPFAIGVRIEHPQALIDSSRYHCEIRSNFLPPAGYSLVGGGPNRGVFSFCMCPGGIIAPAATNYDEIVVNGWSPSKRNNKFANSGIVVSVNEKDFAKCKFNGTLAAMHYQQMVEKNAYLAGGGNLVAPAQRMVDFVAGKVSTNLPECSYLPGLSSVKLDNVLPNEVSIALKKGFTEFGKKMKGYYTNDAVLVATESRTSSPVRIQRDKDTLQHIQIKGLYPCAEGAGYAGGIVSAAIDGERCAEAIANSLL